MTLVEFLEARLDEDEQVAQATRTNEQFVYGTDRWFASHSNAITSMAPHRAVAEVKAKRQILSLHRVDDEGGFDPICNVCLYTPPCETLQALALPYADHPDYREKWRL